MSLLHQEEMDDAARGEELTRGSSHVIWAGIAAAVLLSAAVAVIMIVGEKPPLETGEVVAVWAHPLHTETSGFDANGAPQPKESFDQVLVFAQVRIHNQSKAPLFLMNIQTNATLDDAIHTSYAATAVDFDRIFVGYPSIPVPHQKALALETEIDPGQTAEGMFVSAFRLTQQQWDTHKNLDFSFTFRYQPSLVLTPKVAVIEQ